MAKAVLEDDSLEDKRKKVMLQILNMLHKTKASHIGSCFSVLDILLVLYEKILNVDPTNPNFEKRDYLLLSKGHAAAALYAVLAERGFFDKKELDTYLQENSSFLGHASHHIKGVEFSTGSLGHAFSVALGMGLAGKNVYVILSDGELDEGSNWESFLFKAHHKLKNVKVIIDYNKIQSFGSVKNVIGLEPLREKFEAFGLKVLDVNGHDFDKLEEVLKEDFDVLIAHTIKGKGVSFMENSLAWHYKNPNEEELELAKEELLSKSYAITSSI